MNDWLETEQFYNAMQAYRFASIANQENVVAAFEEVKRLLRRYFGPDRCTYPDCTENEDGTCGNWLAGICSGPDK